MKFTDLKLSEPLQKALKEVGYETPTPIQQQAIPVVLSGTDLLATAQTGTGKTAAFTLPILELLSQQSAQPGKKKIKVLILTPTRELAIQIQENIEQYSRNLPIQSTVIFGGVKQGAQESAMRKGVDILVATPGRLLDFLQQKIVDLRELQFFVLDEADRMLDMGFVHDVRRVLKYIPAKRQTLFFSATFPDEIQKLAGEILNKPERISVTPVASTAETIQQKAYLVEKDNKPELLVHILENDITEDAVLVFSRTKYGADKIAKRLKKNNIPAEAIHGDKSQNQRQNALQNFKSGKTRILVATDIAARGIDIDELKYVINYELSDVSETYVHRIGRTGRAGNSGQSISFVDGLDLINLKNTEKLIGKKIPIEKDHPYHTDDLVVQKRDSNNKPFTPARSSGPRPAGGGQSRFSGNRKAGPRNNGKNSGRN